MGENHHITCNIPSIKLADGCLLRNPITIGRTVSIRSATIQKIGGFQAFRDYLAEDHLMGVHIQELGYKVRLSHYCVDNVNVNWSIGRFLNRHLRWAKMRRHLNLAHYSIELLSNPVTLATVYWLVNPTIGAALFLGTICLVKILGDLAVDIRLGSDLKVAHFLAIPFKDLLIAAIWFIPFFSRHVNWRGHRFRITDQTALRPAD